MAKHLLLSDIHATRTPPSSCTELYWQDVQELLWQSVQVARDEKVASVVWAGDVFHHKAPGRTDHAVVKQLQRVIEAYPCPALGVGGNHDMSHDRAESIEQTQPLGVLAGRGGLVLLNGWASEMYQDEERREYGMLPLFGVPWQQHWSEEGLHDLLEPYRERVFGAGTGGQRTLVVTHAPIYPPGREPGYPGAEYTPAWWWSGGMGSYGSCFYGHVHEQHGWWEDAGVEFCNNGALSRGSLDESNLERTPGCTLWDDQTGMFRFYPLRGRPADELFRLEEHTRDVTAQASRAEFLSHVREVRLPVLTVEGVIEEIKRDGGLSARVIEVAGELLTEAAYEKGKH